VALLEGLLDWGRSGHTLVVPMARRMTSALVACMAIAAAGAGCGSGTQEPPDGAAQDADFLQCDMTPAVDYAAGMHVTSTSGAYVVTLVSAKADPPGGGTTVNIAASGTDTWTVSVTDASGGAPSAVTMTGEKPWMPVHMHGSSTYPTVTAGDPGMFIVSKLDFFMTGYWSVPFDLQATAGTADAGAMDKATFAICLRQ
jgi:hypothetical protein